MFMRSALDSSIALIVAVFISSALVSMNFKVSNMSGLSEPKMTPSLKLCSFQLSSPLPNFCTPLKAFGQIVLLPSGMLWRCPTSPTSTFAKTLSAPFFFRPPKKTATLAFSNYF